LVIAADRDAEHLLVPVDTAFANTRSVG